MPKTIELTLQINIQKVSCPGVWLCQDGLVSLTVYALDSNYQTSLVPPVFPLLFEDVLYFRKLFQETCTINNICCILKNETIYCELVQWSADCSSEECIVLAQYLGALNDVLFPPPVCSSDGVDLLMRRTKNFPGILSPKIEISTKVRIDELGSQSHPSNVSKGHLCECQPQVSEIPRQKAVCHTPHYHRYKCNSGYQRPCGTSRSSRSDRSKSCCSLPTKGKNLCYQRSIQDAERDENMSSSLAVNSDTSCSKNYVLESRYLKENCDCSFATGTSEYEDLTYLKPCVCNICRRYYECFHT